METLEELRATIAEAKEHLEQYNAIANRLAAIGITIELDTVSIPHGVVGVGKVNATELHASFNLELG